MKPARWFALALTGLLAACGSGGDAPRALVLVTLDTTRADRLGSYGYPNAGTPHLDALAARGVRFERALSPVPITLPAHTSLFTASYPPYHGVRDNGTFVVDPALDTLAERLQAEGLRTAAFVSALPLEARFGLDQGFDFYDQSRAADGGHMNERRAGDTIDRALIWLGDVGPDEEFFLWVHLFDPHYPYAPPGPLAPGHDAYQGEVSYADAQLGRLFGALEDAGRMDATAIVVTADHGESLGDHGELSHGHLLYDATQRVPLLMAGPGAAAGRVVERTVDLVDIAPTVCEWLGVDAPELRAQGGRSLHGLLTGAPEETLAAQPQYLETILPRLHSGWSELYGVAEDGATFVEAPGAGRAELRVVGQAGDQLLADPARSAELATTLAALRAELPPAEPFAAHAAGDADEELLAGLAALGYLGIDHMATASDAPGRDPRLVIEARSAAERVRTHLDAGALPAAETELARIAAVDPDGLIHAEFSGLVAMAQTPPDLAAAAEAYDRATTLAPGRRNLWVQLAGVQRELGDPAAALLSVQRAKALAPPSERILALEAILLDETGAR